MKRPSIKKYQVSMTADDSILVNDYKRYSEALGIYCDSLERALDKACDMLETYDLANKELTRESIQKKNGRNGV